MSLFWCSLIDISSHRRVQLVEIPLAFAQSCGNNLLFAWKFYANSLLKKISCISLVFLDKSEVSIAQYLLSAKTFSPFCSLYLVCRITYKKMALGILTNSNLTKKHHVFAYTGHVRPVRIRVAYEQPLQVSLFHGINDTTHFYPVRHLSSFWKCSELHLEF